MQIERMLKGNELFQSLSVKDVHKISDLSAVKEFDRNDIIFKNEQPGSHIYVLLDGLVSLALPSAPQELGLNIARVEKGEIFGLSPLLNSPRYTATAMCLARSKVLMVEAKSFRKILEKDHVVGMDVMSRVARIYFDRYINLLQRMQQVLGQLSAV
jgi:CRP/FNR family cyclic AMP-dependent transcriptional regulator